MASLRRCRVTSLEVASSPAATRQKMRRRRCHIRKCREASSLLRDGKSGKEIEKTINLRGGGVGGIAPPQLEVQGGIRRFDRGKKWQKNERQSASEEAAFVALRRHIWKCREASGVLIEGKSSKKLKKTINL